jgi:hypothetical protein
MNTILKEALFVVSGIGICVLFYFFKNKFFKKTKTTVTQIADEDKAKVKELYEKGLVPEKIYKQVCSIPEPTECFNTKKAITGLIDVKNPVLWMKDLASLLNVRKLIIVGIIIGIVWGFGYYKGHGSAPAYFDMEGKEVTIKLNEHYLKIYKDGSSAVLDKDGKILKIIKVSDIPELRKAIKSYGFDLKPFATAGGSLGLKEAKAEGGLGLQIFKWYKWAYDVFITSAGAYPLGISYKLTDNCSAIVGAGVGYKGDNRFYGGIKFIF